MVRVIPLANTARYRLKQGLRALFAFGQPLNERLADIYLTQSQRILFRRLRRMERLHSLNVLRAVRVQSPDTPTEVTSALAIAALLHDSGKTRYPLSLAEKSFAVLVRAFIPTLFRRWSAGDPRYFWMRPCIVYTHHPAWSAALMAAAGAPEDAIWLAAHHAEDAEQWRDDARYSLLKRLQAADDTN